MPTNYYWPYQIFSPSDITANNDSSNSFTNREFRIYEFFNEDFFFNWQTEKKKKHVLDHQEVCFLFQLHKLREIRGKYS